MGHRVFWCLMCIVKVNDGGKFGQQVELIPIDHGLCLPTSLEDPYFESIHWPQASIPFSEDELDYIESLGPYQDSEMLRNELPMIREACLRVLTLCTIFQKQAAGFGLCLAEIGEMMTREFRRGEEAPSELEVLCMEARRAAAETNRETFVLSPKTGLQEDSFQFEIVYDDLESSKNPTLPFQFGFGRNPLSKLEEEDENEEDVQVPASASFVKVADMTYEEWSLFLEKFRGLLWRTLTARKSGGAGPRQRRGSVLVVGFESGFTILG
ncbi:putative 1-phosphatidylinositol 4-kinase [Helianthus annuus]|nr:putative 1-phosphatidylinositol 4-kinase [Helianthus annuus]